MLQIPSIRRSSVCIVNEGILPDIITLSNGYVVKFFLKHFNSDKYLNNIFRGIDLMVTTTAIVYDQNDKIISVIDDIVKIGIRDLYLNLIHMTESALCSWTCFLNNNDIDDFIVDDCDSNELYVQYNKDNIVISVNNEQFIIQPK